MYTFVLFWSILFEHLVKIKLLENWMNLRMEGRKDMDVCGSIIMF